MSSPITRLDTRLLRAPLRRPWGPDVPDLTIIEVVVEDADGAVGRGFSWTPTIGGHAVRALLDHDIREFVLGRPADAVALWPDLWARLHEAGGGGVTTIAMAGVDLALWDLAGRRAGVGLVDLLGRRRADTTAYGSGVNLHYPLDELVAQAGRWVDAGFTGVKVKVGSPDLADDVRRIRAVRETIGPDRFLAIDANQRWSVSQAERAIGELAVFDLRWIEEPLRADDLPGHVELRERLGRAGVDVSVALGENVHTRYRFAEFLAAGVVDVVQPNVVRVGGITPFREIAELAAARGVEVAPHLLPDLSGQLALTLGRDTLVESVEDASFADLGVLAGPAPVVIEGGRARDTGRVGLGIELTDAAPGAVRETPGASTAAASAAASVVSGRPAR